MTTTNMAPAAKLLLKELKSAGWTDEAMEYICRAVLCHEELLSLVKSITDFRMNDEWHKDAAKVIAKAERHSLEVN